MTKPKKGGTYYSRNREEVLAKARTKRAEARSTEKLNDARRRARGGSFTAGQWKELLEQTDHKCARCRRALPLSPDHITPVSKGGSALIENIQPLCDDCNRWKGNRVIRNFLLDPLDAEEVKQVLLSLDRRQAAVAEDERTDDMPVRILPPTVKRGLSVGYLDWIDRYGFYVQESFNLAENDWQGAGKLELMPHQRAILAEALRQDDKGNLVFEDILYSDLMKSGKTAIAASIAVWYAEVAPPGVEIYILANSLEQAEGRVMRDVKFHARVAWPDATINEYVITLPNGTEILAQTKSAKSGSGTRRSLVVYDELWGYTTEADRRMWSEFTPIPTVSNPLRVVVTYAGYENESDLLWDHYLRGVSQNEHAEGKAQDHALYEDGLPVYINGRMFTYWNHEPRMPWQTIAYYDARLLDERPADYLRHHENRWASSTETYLNVDWWDAAAKKFPAGIDLYAEHPYRYYPVWVGVDVAPKHDSSAVVGVTYDGARARIIMLYAKVWTPERGVDFDLEATVEKYILNMTRSSKTVGVFYDPAQFHRSMVTLKRQGVPMYEYTQSDNNMIAASQNLFDLLRTGALEAYPHPDVRAHLKAAVAKATSRGFRIIKTEHQRSTDKYKAVIERRGVDAAIALSMAAWNAVNQGGMEVSQPVRWEVPFSDSSAWPHRDPAEMMLPPQFRSN